MKAFFRRVLGADLTDEQAELIWQVVKALFLAGLLVALFALAAVLARSPL